MPHKTEASAPPTPLGVRCRHAVGVRHGGRTRCFDTGHGFHACFFINNTTMWHPMHLHGHTFALTDSGVRKDTAIVLPGSTLEVDFDADNPGRWMVHCHNVYHAESGMMTLIGYRD